MTTYNNLSALAAAAAAQDCTVHMHIGANGKPVFSVGNGNVGAREYGCYFDALASVMETRNSITELYAHPDGAIIEWDDETGELTVSNDDAQVTVDIGAGGLRYMAESILDLLEDGRDDAADYVEEAGNVIATDMLNDVLAKSEQAERMVVIKEALMELGRLPYPEAACAGFALALVNIIEVGLSNLPKGDQ